ncbi:MAG: IS1380 family transposase [Planctomycetes bacterium]|nr:IS1380 family transposase [Planctomycetota bacterium]
MKEPDIHVVASLLSQPINTKQAHVRLSREEVRSATHTLPEIRFEEHDLTSFSGLVILQALSNGLQLRKMLQDCVRHLSRSVSYGASTMLLILITHSFLGWRRLRDLDYYRDDPLLKRFLGLRRVPDVSTLSRRLPQMDERVVTNMRKLIRSLVIERVKINSPSRVTIDFDGSVISTKSRRTEGTAVGYNKKKGQRSYYPLFATVAQTGQVFDVLHRSGNVHDSNGALEFVKSCIAELRESGFRGRIETRMDGAHFSEQTCGWLEAEGVDFSISVPFERFPEVKGMIRERSRWNVIDDEWSCFELTWKPKKWASKMRCIIYRRLVRKPIQGPIQLDLFRPIEREWEYKMVITNKTVSAKAVLHYHNGRGSQEGIFAELKSQGSLDYIPTRREIGNRVYMLSCVIAHTLGREMQMESRPPERRHTPTRACLWVFEKLDTIRKGVIQRAGRLTRPSGRLTLTMAGNERVAGEFERLLRPWARRAA